MPSKFDTIEALSTQLTTGRTGVPLQDLILLRAINYVSNRSLQVARTGLKPYGLTEWSFRALVILPSAADGTPRPISMAHLGLLAGESGPNLTRICDELVKAGLAVRKQSPQDRRKVFLALTARGEAVVEKTAPDMWGLLRWCMKVLTKDEKAVMTGLLKRVADRLEDVPSLTRVTTRPERDTGDDHDPDAPGPQRGRRPSRALPRRSKPRRRKSSGS